VGLAQVYGVGNKGGEAVSNITLPRAVGEEMRDALTCGKSGRHWCPHCDDYVDNFRDALDAALAEPKETFAESLFRRSWEAHRAALAEPEPQECWCHKCNSGRLVAHMIVCPTCGNKRCPRASDHELPCTDSNEPGQPGSVYALAPPEPPAIALLTEIRDALRRMDPAWCALHGKEQIGDEELDELIARVEDAVEDGDEKAV
jgi:hypothetical protein